MGRVAVASLAPVGLLTLPLSTPANVAAHSHSTDARTLTEGDEWRQLPAPLSDPYSSRTRWYPTRAGGTPPLT